MTINIISEAKEEEGPNTWVTDLSWGFTCVRIGAR